MWENKAAKPEYATAKIAVWWNMKGCPIPEGYDARRVRPNLEGAFKQLGYSGPVSITAYGDQRQTPCHLLQGLSSTGVAVVHTKPETICSLMYSDMLEWRGHNPPPATMMLISDQVKAVFSWDLARLQQRTTYNLFLAYPSRPRATSVLKFSADWLWNTLLEPKSALVQGECSESSELSAMFYCKPCYFHGQSVQSFRRHISSKKHAVQEVINRTSEELDPVTRMWGKNYVAEREFATAQIAVWWDMEGCPIPEGYDALRVRPSLEGAFKQLGYSGPVSITAYGDLRQTPDHLLRGLSSTGVAVAHTIPEVQANRMFRDMVMWPFRNPPPATMMLISNRVEETFSDCLVRLLQRRKYNLFLAYSYRPYKMSAPVTSAEWLWESLLAVSETRRHVLQKCSERSESTEMFYCKVCIFNCKSLDNLRKHLSSEEHAQELPPGGSSSSKLKKRKKGDAVEGGVAKKKKKLEEDDSFVVNHDQTNVWWDLENVGLPKRYSAERVHEFIVKNLAEKGFTGPVNVTAVVAYKDSFVPRGLLNIQIDIVKKFIRPRNSKKDQTAYDGIRARVEKWLENGSQPQNVMLITGDNGFADLFANVKAAGHTTMVVFQKNVGQPWSSVAIKESAQVYWDDWRSFLGLPSKNVEKEMRAAENKRLAKEKKQRYRIRMSEKRKRKKERKRVESAASGSRP